ncbi:DUF5018 domain-containing protein [Cellulophaga sp. L1A9]|uniref:DUF5018 domain-containing protein n=1 Tax=Cellulophaga sp. L1A9 TaxID=2686362 RepID=UPI001E334F66|nr:DUF5018 domain-containing protein [Cellulophaga sp. L1A9]
MKNIGLCFSLILLVIISCTKEVGLYTEVEFEISETHVADGFINTPLATSITVTPEELVDSYSYTYSYKINTGEGYFQDESGATISEGDKIGLNPLSASLNYIATKIGDHSITFTAEDTFGFAEAVTLSYTISNVPVSWTATGPTGQVLLGTSQDITVVLGSETTGTGVTYERNYSFTEGTGNLTSSPTGTSETLNEFVSILPGTYTLTYVSTEVGQTTLEFLLKDSNGQEIVKTVSFEVVDELSTEKEITSFIVNGVAGTPSGTSINLVLPEGTDLTALSPVIIHTGASISPESETTQDFTNPVIYTVTAQDQTIQEYTVTLSVEGNDAKDITDFIIDGVDGIITGTNISVILPAGTDVTALNLTVIHTGASVNPTSGVAQDFTNPVEYTVTAADGTTKVYTITVSLAPALSSDNDITSFSIDGVAGVISGTTITVSLPAGTDVSTLTPAIIHNGNTINPDTGIAQDFTNPITYTVTADNLDTQEYSVTVIMPTLSDTKDITSFSIDGVAGVISGTTITVTLPAGTDASSLTPAIIHNGNTINPDTGVAQDFTNPVEYTVAAANGSTKAYNVTIVVSSIDFELTSTVTDDSFGVTGFYERVNVSANQSLSYTVKYTNNFNLPFAGYNSGDEYTIESFNIINEFYNPQDIIGDHILNFDVTSGGITKTTTISINYTLIGLKSTAPDYDINIFDSSEGFLDIIHSTLLLNNNIDVRVTHYAGGSGSWLAGNYLGSTFNYKLNEWTLFTDYSTYALFGFKFSLNDGELAMAKIEIRDENDQIISTTYRRVGLSPYDFDSAWDGQQ